MLASLPALKPQIVQISSTFFCRLVALHGTSLLLYHGLESTAHALDTWVIRHAGFSLPGSQLSALAVRETQNHYPRGLSGVLAGLKMCLAYLVS